MVTRYKMWINIGGKYVETWTEVQTSHKNKTDKKLYLFLFISERQVI